MLTTLTSAECWRLLRRTGVGRLATAARGTADVYPVNFVVDGSDLLIRTAAGVKLEQILEEPHVALEIDGHDASGYWSVVVRGVAELDVASGEARDVLTWNRADGATTVRIRATAVSGRRLERARFDGPSVFGPPDGT